MKEFNFYTKQMETLNDIDLCVTGNTWLKKVYFPFLNSNNIWFDLFNRIIKKYHINCVFRSLNIRPCFNLKNHDYNFVFFSFQKHVLDQFWWISRRSCRCHTRSRKYLDLFLWFEIGVWHFSSPWFKVLIWFILPGINFDYSTLLSERTENRFTPAQNKFLTTIIS